MHFNAWSSTMPIIANRHPPSCCSTTASVLTTLDRPARATLSDLPMTDDHLPGNLLHAEKCASVRSPTTRV